MINETRKRGRRYTIFGVLLAAVSALIVLQVINRVEAAAQPPPPEPTLPVVYMASMVGNQELIRDWLDEEALEDGPAEDVCPEEVLDKSEVIGAFQVCMIPTRFIPQNAVQLEAFEAPDLINSETVRAALREEVGSLAALMELERGTILQRNLLGQSTLAPGMREVSIAVDPVTSVGWKVRPGQHVDVVVSYEQVNGSEREPRTELFLQNVEVMSVSDETSRLERVGIVQDAELDEEFDVYAADEFESSFQMEATVTLALSLEDSIRLVHMANFANEVRLLLRNAEDDGVEELDTVSIIQTR